MEQDLLPVGGRPISAFWVALIGICLGLVLAGSQYLLSTQTVEICIDGVSFRHETRAQTVSGVLSELGIFPASFERITPNLHSRVTTGLSIKLVQAEAEVTGKAFRPEMPDFSAEYITEKIPIPFLTTKRPVTHLYKGTEEIEVAGKEGLLERTRKLVYRDNKLVSDILIVEKVVSEPVDEVVLVGQKEPVKTVATSHGTYRYKEVKEMLATAYYPGPECTAPSDDGLTAIGLIAGHGIVAVDPKVIPLRTRVYIPGYGVALAGDVGGAIKGNRVDLCYETFKEAVDFGRKMVQVYILE